MARKPSSILEIEVTIVRRSILLSACAIALGARCASAGDFNPLGVYVGAAAGPSYDTFTDLGAREPHDTAWQVVAGLRPLPFLGAELEYTDFGTLSPRAPAFPNYPGSQVFANATEHAQAGGLFAVGYLPIPLSPLDVFGKVGWERVNTTASYVPQCPPYAFCPAGPLMTMSVRDTESDVAYGGGVQVRIPGLRSLALRAEYEQTETRLGRPALLSFGATWTF
jgi:hypothetical protein